MSEHETFYLNITLYFFTIPKKFLLSNYFFFVVVVLQTGWIKIIKYTQRAGERERRSGKKIKKNYTKKVFLLYKYIKKKFCLWITWWYYFLFFFGRVWVSVVNKKFNNQQTFASLTRQTTREAQNIKIELVNNKKLRHKNEFVQLSDCTNFFVNIFFFAHEEFVRKQKISIRRLKWKWNFVPMSSIIDKLLFLLSLSSIHRKSSNRDENCVIHKYNLWLS